MMRGMYCYGKSPVHECSMVNKRLKYLLERYMSCGYRNHHSY